MGIQKQVRPILSTWMMPQLGTVPNISIPLPLAKDHRMAQGHGDGSPQAIFWDNKG